MDGGHKLSISEVFLITATLDRNQLLGPLEVILHSANPRTASPPASSPLPSQLPPRADSLSLSRSLLHTRSLSGRMGPDQ